MLSRFAMLIFATMLLAACGQGGGSGDSGAPTAKKPGPGPGPGPRPNGPITAIDKLSLGQVEHIHFCMLLLHSEKGAAESWSLISGAYLNECVDNYVETPVDLKDEPTASDFVILHDQMHARGILKERISARNVLRAVHKN